MRFHWILLKYNNKYYDMVGMGRSSCCIKNPVKVSVIMINLAYLANLGIYNHGMFNATYFHVANIENQIHRTT